MKTSTTMSKVKLPFEIKDFNHAEIKKIDESFFEYFTGFSEQTKFVRVGPKNYVLFANYKEEATEIYNMNLRPTDVLVASLPRSGTTWTQELVWLLANDLDYEQASSICVLRRYKTIGKTILSEILTRLDKSKVSLDDTDKPRFYKTHLPFSLLSPTLVDNSKVVYIARNPKDVAVSTYHLSRLVKFVGANHDFKRFWNFFLHNAVLWGPHLEHVKEAWALRNHPNMLFLFYEDLLMDLKSTVRKVSKFLNKEYTEEQISVLCEHLRFDNIKTNKSVNISLCDEFNPFLSNKESFIRKGKVGGWRDYFDEQMMKQADQWIAENLSNTDLRFPNV